MNTSPLPEPPDDFLSRPPSLPVDAALQESLFQKTASLRPRPRRWRMPIIATAAAGVLLALLLSYIAFRAGHDASLARDSHDRPREAAPSAAMPSGRDTGSASSPTLAAAQPQDLEWRAFDAEDDQERARLYFRAGDLYLSMEQDIDGALRCYHQALACCDNRELAFDPTDNWLVMALKNDRRKEP